MSRSGQYWKAEKLTRSERIERLLKQFQEIKKDLDQHIKGIPDFIPAPSEVATLASLKPVEDMLDGLICAWIGIEHLKGRTIGLGDDTSAIWTPKDVKTREAAAARNPGADPQDSHQLQPPHSPSLR